MGVSNLLGIARDGLTAQSAALTTTGSNIANATTPGYVRRTAVLESTFAGGVRFVGMQRTFNRFAYAHVIDEQGKFSAAETRSGALSEVEAAVTPPTGTIGDDATALVKAFNALSAFPIDPSLRADVIAKSENLADTINGTYHSLQAQSQNLLDRSQDVILELNQRIKNVADLNKQIATAQGVGGDTAALRDQRDVVIREIGQRMGARAIEDGTGRVALYAGGSVLVEGDNASTLSMDLEPNTGKMRFYATGVAKSEITNRIDTGTLGGLREARDVDIADTIDKLDAYAYDVANAFNSVHTTGYGLDSVNGRPLFTPPATQKGAGGVMALDPSMAGHPERVGASANAADVPGGNTVMLKLANLADTQSFGGKTLPDRFADIATDLGFRKTNADSETQLRTDTLSVAETLTDDSSGVSIDEEMVDLTKYQRAFEASSKVLRTVDELFQTLMDSIR